MARFLHHEACPSCGSRDNLARYDDGSAYCFGCKYYERSTLSARFSTTGPLDGAEQTTAPLGVGTTSLPEDAVRYLQKYSISVPEALKRGIRWEPSRKQLIYHFYDQDGNLACTQARNFDPFRANKSKYFNVGEKEKAFPLYEVHHQVRQNSVVITEDALSAIKIARQMDAMPALGTSFPMSKALTLQKLGYIKAFVWLDRDKWKEGMEIADRFKWLGMSVKAVYTEKDPKEYTQFEIQKYLDM